MASTWEIHSKWFGVWAIGPIMDRNEPSFSVSLQPNQLTLNQFSAFLQDEISLVQSAAFDGWFEIRT